jgi:phage-related protein
MLEGGPDSEATPMFRVLAKWGHEMRQCQRVDPEHQSKYYNTSSEVDATQMGRLLDFLERHNLYRQFLAEDEAGKR